MADKNVVDKINEKQQEHFNKLNSIELKNIGRNFSDDERKDICAVLPSNMLKEELARREKVALEIIQELMEVLASIYGTETTLEQMEEIISKVRQIVRVNINELGN